MPEQSSNKIADIARRKLLLRGSATLAALSLTPVVALSASSSPRQEIILKLQQETGLEAGFIEKAISQARYDASVIKRIKTPYESRPYKEYRPLFVNQRLADKGLAYLKEHQQIFKRAEKRYGVQPEIIAAILGMETRYGHYKGKDRVLDALYTLATGYPRRANFFRNELGEFLQLCHEEELSPISIRGSYAGAFGTTQFIPSSYRGYAVDADSDGRRDVWDGRNNLRLNTITLLCTLKNLLMLFQVG